MQYDFDKEVNRKGSLSVKWDAHAIKSICGVSDAEPFWVADMDFTAAPEIMDQVVQTAKSGVYGYPHFSGTNKLFCEWAKKRHNWEVEEKDVVICMGMLNSIALLTDILTDEKDGIIVPMPAYQPFVRIVNNLDRTLLRWPLSYDKEAHKFSLDWEKYEQLCKQAKLLIFCSPHNPSGLEFSPGELERLCRIAADNNVTIICDEIHADLSFGKHQPLLPIAQNVGCKAITCMAPSKTFNIAGEHYSVAIIEDEGIRKALKKRMSQLFISETSFFSTTTAMSAYRYGYDWLLQLIPYLQKNIAFIDGFCNEKIPQLHLIKPKASFIALLDCSEILPLVEADAKANPDLYNSELSPGGGLLSRFFGIRAKVAVNDGTWFGGEDYRGFVRFNYGTQRSSIEKAFNRIEQAIAFLQTTYTR
ncbi:bifunctional PLP-dependent enzyme with beta-cystathionase and maltose regulon repressor activities [Sphaerochaeta pleomorpha str. Grapes]|uniref:cysteine-S-conjugate beta-lyase n=1 Tax=Sphaerochaeta pleomorpha (strain ATCC BAA-1885 / DSM 22778 / Grapes) TaxID=158190 RepID=G8QUQ7_SPHPG|nr:aminotransferase class I/II-fold pyridoxal phosphate-dependent enzyme [Sphaerochaeta pleomorpha]AEV30365.1 bifunctional PLP-dependent enzyme with beta-cystathionase and maltose regulon repressor activities [Sphaerochaeta pleomorpha str. Grapes]